MATWYKVTMPYKDCGVDGKGQFLQDAFSTLLIANGGKPWTAALCSQRSDDFKNVAYYFSPDAAQLARSLVEKYKAVPCEQPPRPSPQSHVVFCGGDARALDLLWPAKQDL